jgi:adenosylcobinamide-GDP ribazoletransferase
VTPGGEPPVAADTRAAAAAAAPLGRIAVEARVFLVALQFLTRVPVRLARYDPRWLTDGVRWFPAVGALVGAFGAAVAWGAMRAWPAPVAVVLSMIATVWLTGAFHEDGLADTCDGLGGAVPRERALEIMKDSRVGTYGLAGLVGALALKAVLLVDLAHGGAPALAAALVAGHAVSRLMPVALLRVLPYAGDPAHAKAKPLAQHVGAGGLAWAAATAVMLVTGLAAARIGGLDAGRLAAACAAAAATAALCARTWRRRLGGFTGDTLGATQQLAELAFYLALAAR